MAVSGQETDDGFKNFYELLGVARDADRAEIEAARHNLAKQHHPDRAGGSKEMFVRVNAAVEVLLDPERRAAHDQQIDERAANDRGGADVTAAEASEGEGEPTEGESTTRNFAYADGPGPDEEPAPLAPPTTEMAYTAHRPGLWNYLVFAASILTLMFLFVVVRSVLSREPLLLVDPDTTPQIEVFPRRAEAGRDVVFQVEGWGCPEGRTVLLQVFAVGSGVAAEERVLEDHRLEVNQKASDPHDGERGAWSHEVVFGASLTPGDYRLRVICHDDRGDPIESVAAIVTLVGVAGMLDSSPRLETLEFDVEPNRLRVGTQVQVRFSGEQCHGDQVAIEVFDTAGPVGDFVGRFSTPVDGAGGWLVSHLVASPRRSSIYGVSAVCMSSAGDFEYATQTIRPLGGTLLASGGDLGGDGSTSLDLDEIPRADPATPVEASPRFTG